MNRRQYSTDSGSIVQQSAEATVDRVALSLRLVLAAGETDLKHQMLLLTDAANRALIACHWPQIMPCLRQAPARLEMLAQATDGELTIWLELLPSALLYLRLTHRDSVRPIAEPLYSVEVPMDSGLWEQIREAR